MKQFHSGFEKIDKEMSRYPHCIVWTPIPVLTWFLPFIGHMGICTSAGVIRDFAGPYFVSVSLYLMIENSVFFTDALTTFISVSHRRTTWRLESQQSEFKTSECGYSSSSECF
uniref:Transmembrane protein 222a n=1 Tax=Sinocyclocheilus anshuiensis TaxID=1608454 RepID=A0A671KC10_9TELE